MRWRDGLQNGAAEMGGRRSISAILTRKAIATSGSMLVVVTVPVVATVVVDASCTSSRLSSMRWRDGLQIVAAEMGGHRSVSAILTRKAIASSGSILGSTSPNSTLEALLFAPPELSALSSIVKVMIVVWAFPFKISFKSNPRKACDVYLIPPLIVYQKISPSSSFGNRTIGGILFCVPLTNAVRTLSPVTSLVLGLVLAFTTETGRVKV